MPARRTLKSALSIQKKREIAEAIYKVLLGYSQKYGAGVTHYADECIVTQCAVLSLRRRSCSGLGHVGNERRDDTSSRPGTDALEEIHSEVEARHGKEVLRRGALGILSRSNSLSGTCAQLVRRA